MPGLEEAALIAVIVGMAAWIITNVHLWRVSKAIRKASDDRWAEVQGKVDAKIEDLDKRLDAKVESMRHVQIDAGPIVAAVMEQMGPDVQARINSLKSWWEGKKGAVSKALQDLGDGALEGAAAQAGEAGELTLDQLLASSMVVDPEWAKRHPYALTGLRWLQKSFLQGDGGSKSRRPNRPGAGGGRGEF